MLVGWSKHLSRHVKFNLATTYLKFYENLHGNKWLTKEAYFICFKMTILDPMIMMSLVAKRNLIPLLLNLLGATKWRSLPNALKGGCGSSQDMMIVVYLVRSSIIRMVWLWMCMSHLCLHASWQCWIPPTFQGDHPDVKSRLGLTLFVVGVPSGHIVQPRLEWFSKKFLGYNLT